jgi:hypothetical protein
MVCPHFKKFMLRKGCAITFASSFHNSLELVELAACVLKSVLGETALFVYRNNIFEKTQQAFDCNGKYNTKHKYKVVVLLTPLRPSNDSGPMNVNRYPRSFVIDMCSVKDKSQLGTAGFYTPKRCFVPYVEGDLSEHNIGWVAVLAHKCSAYKVDNY